MLDLKDVNYFVQIVDRGGFTSAAELLGQQKSTLSHRIKALEGSLGVRLINRTSRQFAVTEVGAEFYRHAIELLHGAARAEEAVRKRIAEPSGVIRMTAPIEVTQYLLREALPVFLNRYPKVAIHEHVTERFVDIVGEGFDLAIRGHTTTLRACALVQRTVAYVPWCLFAGPGYLEQHSPINHPRELASHAFIAMTHRGQPRWQLRSLAGEVVNVPITARFQSNNPISLKKAACANLGIAALPGFMCCDELKAGSLLRLLPDWIACEGRLTALMPNRTGLLPAVRLLVDFLAIELPKIIAFDQPVARVRSCT